MHGGAFAVHEGHQHEFSLYHFHLGKVFLLDGFLRQYQCHAVLRKGKRIVAVQIARELVKNNDFGEAAWEVVTPMVKFASRRLLPHGEKLRVNFCVKGIDFGKPIRLRFRRKPEIEYLLRIHFSSSSNSKTRSAGRPMRTPCSLLATGRLNSCGWAASASSSASSSCVSSCSSL